MSEQSCSTMAGQHDENPDGGGSDTPTEPPPGPPSDPQNPTGVDDTFPTDPQAPAQPTEDATRSGVQTHDPRE